jgi:hypothetical protein
MFIFVGCFFVIINEIPKCYDKKSTCNDYGSSPEERCDNAPQGILYFIYLISFFIYIFYMF